MAGLIHEPTVTTHALLFRIAGHQGTRPLPTNPCDAMGPPVNLEIRSLVRYSQSLRAVSLDAINTAFGNRNIVGGQSCFTKRVW